MDFYIPFFQYKPKKEYEDIVSWRVVDAKYQIRTGDILLFSSSSIISTGIKLFTGSRWNHAGMVCWLEIETKDGDKNIDLFCFELGSWNFTDLVTRKIVDKGIRLVRLADIALMYDLIAVRRLNYERPKDFAKKYQKFIIKYINRPFVKSFATLARAFLIYPGFPQGEHTCVQLIAILYDEFGIHKLDFCSSQLSPGHYIKESTTFPDELFLEEEIVIYKDNSLIEKRIFFISLVIIILIVILILKTRRR